MIATKSPLIILLIAIIGAFAWAIYATLKFSGDKLFVQYYYVVPIIIPFITFLFDRAEKFYQRSKTQHLIDAIVVLTAMWRVIGDVPYISGHTLFLTYAILSSSRITQITAAIVMIEVLYLKFFVWQDWITPTSGIILGSLVAVLTTSINLSNQKSKS